MDDYGWLLPIGILVIFIIICIAIHFHMKGCQYEEDYIVGGRLADDTFYSGKKYTTSCSNIWSSKEVDLKQTNIQIETEDTDA